MWNAVFEINGTTLLLPSTLTLLESNDENPISFIISISSSVLPSMSSADKHRNNVLTRLLKDNYKMSKTLNKCVSARIVCSLFYT